MTLSGLASSFADVPRAFTFIATLGRLGLVTRVLRAAPGQGIPPGEQEPVRRLPALSPSVADISRSAPRRPVLRTLPPLRTTPLLYMLDRDWPYAGPGQKREREPHGHHRKHPSSDALHV